MSEETLDKYGSLPRKGKKQKKDNYETIQIADEKKEKQKKNKYYDIVKISAKKEKNKKDKYEIVEISDRKKEKQKKDKYEIVEISDPTDKSNSLTRKEQKEKESIPLVRILVLGDGRVGKTSLVRQLFGFGFPDGYKPTAYDVYEKEVEGDEGKYLFEITDFAGQYSFPPMRRLAISKNDIFVLVYSVVDKNSVSSVNRLRDEIISIKREHTKGIPLIVVGNKTDMLESDSTAVRDAKREIGGWCFSKLVTSAKTGHNLSHLYETLIEECDTMVLYEDLPAKRRFSASQAMRPTSRMFARKKSAPC